MAAYPSGSRRLSRLRGKLVSDKGIPLRPELVHAIVEATRDLPEGYRAEIFSGADARSTGTKNHPNGVALDLQIVDADGKILPAAGFDASLKIYEQLFQSVRIRAKHLFPGKNYTWIWGGAWISAAAGNGDRMHYQIHDPGKPVSGAATASGNYSPASGIIRGSAHWASFMSVAELAAYQAKVYEQAKADYAAGIPSVPKTAAEALGDSPSQPGTDPMASPTSFEARAAGYRKLWDTMTLTRGAECEKAARKILAGKEKYVAVEKATGVPWYFIGVVHMRESSNNFAGVLHNGEHIIGKGTKTRLVPAGRGPFSSWESAAIDALKLKNLHTIKAWPIERLAYESERFNGFGYVRRSINSPYVWAGSNHYIRGKYVADGVFSATHIDQQLGTMSVMAALCKISPEVNERVNGKSSARETAVGVGGGAVAVSAMSFWAGWGAMEWGIALAAFLVVAGLIIWAIRKYRTMETTDVPPMTDEPALTADRAGTAEDEPEVV